MSLFVVILIGVVVAIMLLVGAIVTKEQIERQNRILRLKRFRRETSARKVDFDASDKRTVV